jgi:hypothetical protein
VAELLSYPAGCGGLMVSGGTMANFVGFLAARRSKAPWDVRAGGLAGKPGRAAPGVRDRRGPHLAGEGGRPLRPRHRRRPPGPHRRRPADGPGCAPGDGGGRRAVRRPALPGGRLGRHRQHRAVDPLPELAAVCRARGLWFHVDGAYGAPAVALPDAPPDLAGLREADSLAVDPPQVALRAPGGGGAPWCATPSCCAVRSASARPTTPSATPRRNPSTTTSTGRRTPAGSGR